MATAGYSGTPLAKKLGLKPGYKLLIIHAPEHYFEWLEEDVSTWLCKAGETPHFIHLFAASRKEFEGDMKKIKPFIKKNPTIVIWVSWHKKSSGIPTDITEDLIRDFALKNGLVDVKVCAVSETWSGLKLVVPLKLR